MTLVDRGAEDIAAAHLTKNVMTITIVRGWFLILALNQCLVRLILPSVLTEEMQKYSLMTGEGVSRKKNHGEPH